MRSGLRSTRDIYLHILQQISPKSGDNIRFGDNTPYYGTCAHRILELFPDAKFIHIYRDPRDVVASLRSQYWWTAKSAIRAAEFCQQALQKLSDLSEELGSQRLHTVQYEKLLKHPEEELKRICEFLDEIYEPTMLEFTNRTEPGYLRVEHEWKSLTQQPLTTSRIGIYRNNLSLREAWSVERTLGPLMSEYGYISAPTSLLPIVWAVMHVMERSKLWLIHLMGRERPLLDKQSALQRRNELAEST